MPTVTSTHVFRPNRSYRDMAIALIVLFALIGGIGVPIFLLQDERGRSKAWWLGLESAAFVCLGLYFLRYYQVGEIAIATDTLTFRGVFRRRSCRIEEVNRVEWRVRPMGGCVIIRAPTKRFVINFVDYSHDDAAALMDLIHSAFPNAIQANVDSCLGFKSWHLAPPEPAISNRGHLVIAGLFTVGSVALGHCATLGLPQNYALAAGVSALAAVATLAHRHVQIARRI